MTASRQLITAGSAAGAPCTPAVLAGGFVYASGTLPLDDAGTIVARGDVAAQTRRVLERLQRLLAAAGSSLADVVSATVYLTSAADFQTMNGVYRTFWTAAPPTRTTVITRLEQADALVMIAAVAVPAGGERTVVLPADWIASPNPYSYAIRSGDTLFLSGLVPRRGRDNSPIAGDIGVQTRAIMDNAAELLDAAGMSFANVVSSRVYLTGASSFAGMNAAYAESFPNRPPARATVISGLAGPDFIVEMTFTASAAPREMIGTPPNGLPLSPAIKAGRRLYLSGMLGNTPETAGDVAAQTRETLARIARTLDAAGASAADVVDSTVYLTDIGDGPRAAMDDAYSRSFTNGFPARTTIGTGLVAPDGLVEIMVTAVVP